MNNLIRYMLPIFSFALIALGYVMSVNPKEFGKDLKRVVSVSIVIMIIGTIGLLISLFT